MLPINDKSELEHAIGSALTDVRQRRVNTCNELGTFDCEVETSEGFTTLKRRFTTEDTNLSIPFQSTSPGLHMLFSLDGRSNFNTRRRPFTLASHSHSLSFFRAFECINVLDRNAHQHDITFRVEEKFYNDFFFTMADQRGSAMYDHIINRREFNTINHHRPTDPAISALLNSIINCPFEGAVKDGFQREYLRALLMLQLYHFRTVVTGDSSSPDTKISRKDEHILQEVKQYLDLSFLDPCSLDGLSKRFGINEFKLKCGFRSLFNDSPIRYVQQKRLQFALLLLKETDKTIKEIAREIGYAHSANFTLAFTRHFGKAPQHFRQSRTFVEASI